MNKEAIFLLGVFQGLGLELSSRAIHWADEAHRGQKRTSGADYIDHPLRVARMGYGLMCDKAIIGELKPGHPAGISHDDLDAFLAFLILHDTDEDTARTSAEIASEFGLRVARMVGLVTKKKSLPAEKYYAGMDDEILVVLGKAIDRVCNVDDMVETFPPERLEKYINETEMYVLALMKRARKRYVHYANLLILCRDYIKGVLRGAKKKLEGDRRIIELERENARLKGELRKSDSRLPGIQAGD